jgi:formiminoglutamase
MKLPLILSVPHAGLTVPDEVREYCALTPEQILADSDGDAAEIYNLKSEVVELVTTSVARAIIDLNRAEDNRRRDGVVKTHTCYGDPVYHRPVSEDLVEIVLENYHRPYHRRLSQCANNAKLGVDCHTMAAVGPPAASDAGRKRPEVCLSNAHQTCPQDWFDKLIQCFEESFGCKVSVDHPFKGGHIVRSHRHELSWVQIELSRAPFLENTEKRSRILNALNLFCTSTLKTMV